MVCLQIGFFFATISLRYLLPTSFTPFRLSVPIVQFVVHFQIELIKQQTMNEKGEAKKSIKRVKHDILLAAMKEIALFA